MTADSTDRRNTLCANTLHCLNNEQTMFLASVNLVAGGEAYRANYARAHFTEHSRPDHPHSPRRVAYRLSR